MVSVTKKKVWIIISAAVLLCAVAALTVFLLVFNGVILLNNPSKSEFPVRGVDVSHYQGEIDWQVLAKEDISFAFIKATEGSTYTDKRFEYNFAEAQKTDLAVGAYHFFSFESPGATQAENFIKAVRPFEGMLPPVIDLEFYGNNENDPPKREAVGAQLKIMLDALEAEYGLVPIIYATEESYDTYLKGAYEQYDIWIRDVIFEPELSDGRLWTFWQYTNRETLDGYKGEERYIDVNVFKGTTADFDGYPRYRPK